MPCDSATVAKFTKTSRICEYVIFTDFYNKTQNAKTMYGGVFLFFFFFFIVVRCPTSYLHTVATSTAHKTMSLACKDNSEYCKSSSARNIKQISTEVTSTLTIKRGSNSELFDHENDTLAFIFCNIVTKHTHIPKQHFSLWYQIYKQR